MSSDTNLQPDHPQKFEGRNLRTPKRSNSVNDLFLVQFEIDRAAWEALETVPKTAIIEGVIWWNYGDTPEPKAVGEKREKKEKEPKGSYGAYWQRMFQAGYENAPGLVEALGCEPGANNVKLALRALFLQNSLTFVSPEQFEEWAEFHNLAGAVTISRQAVAKAAMV